MPPRDEGKYEEFLRLWERREELGLFTGLDFARALGIQPRTAQRWVKEMRERTANAKTASSGERPGATTPTAKPDNTGGRDSDDPGAATTGLSPTTPRRIALLKVLYDATRGKWDSTATLTRAQLVQKVWGEGLSGDDCPSDDAIWRDLYALCREGLVERVGRGGSVHTDDAYRLNPNAFLQLPTDLAEEAASLARALEPLAPVSPFPETVHKALQLLTSLANPRSREASHVRRTSRSSMPRRRLIKGRVAWERDLIQRYVGELEALARTGQQLVVEYEPAGSALGEWTCEPLGVVYYWVLDAWYLCVRVNAWPEGAVIPPVSKWGRVTLLRLDRIHRFRPTGTRFAYPDGFSLAEYLAVPWGVELGEPFSVTVRFEDAFDVLTRVRQETAHRQRRRLTPIPGGLVYQDVIAGPGEFLRWLRGFGSSAEVLAPDSLRQRARESAERLARLYGVFPPAARELAAAEDSPAGNAAVGDSVGASVAASVVSTAMVAVSVAGGGGEPTTTSHGFGPEAQAMPGSATDCQPLAPRKSGQICTALELFALLAAEGGMTEGELVRRLRLSPPVLQDLMEELMVLGAPLYTPDEPDEEDDEEADDDVTDGAAGTGFNPARRWALLTDRAWLPPPRLDSLQVLALLELAGHLPPVSRARHRRILEVLAATYAPASEGDLNGNGASKGEGESGTSGETLGEAGPVARYRVIKGILDFHPDVQTQRRVELLEEAACMARRVLVLYLPREERQPVKLVLEPLGVVFDTARFLWYVVACRLGHRSRPSLLRVDRIHRCEMCPDHFDYPSDFSLEQYLAPAWGVDVGAEPVPVVVRFWDEASVLEKVRQQLRWRPQARLVKENRPPDERPWGTVESYLYHDMVGGLNSFRRWLRSFGSSAEALVPFELRQAMAEGAVRQLALYCPWAVTLNDERPNDEPSDEPKEEIPGGGQQQ